ncbi:MAG: hypothetical protein AAF380_03215, partial [Bacteroidota bacterium]
KGNLLEDIIISRNYNLMKKDKATGIFQELTDYKEGKYKAIVEGRNYKTDYDAHFKADEEGFGSQVMYGFTLYFGRKELPYVNITYEIPGYQYNEAEITNITHKVGALRTNIRARKALLEEKKKKKEYHEQVVKGHAGKIAGIEKRIEEEIEKKMTSLAKNEVEEKLKKIEQQLEENTQKKQQEEETRRAQQEELMRLEKEKEDIKRLKTRYAFLIYHNKNYPDFLNQLATSLLVSKNAKKEDTTKTSSALEKFDMYCRANYKAIKEECRNDLNITSY